MTWFLLVATPEFGVIILILSGDVRRKDRLDGGAASA